MRTTTERKRDVLEAVETRGQVVVSTGTVADRTDMSPPTARKYLEELEEEGEVVEEILAGNMHVWFTPDVKNRRLTEYVDGDPVESDDDTTEETPAATADGGAGGEVSAQLVEVRETVGELEETLMSEVEKAEQAAARAESAVSEPSGGAGRSPARRKAREEVGIMRTVIELMGVGTAALVLVAAALSATGVASTSLPGVNLALGGVLTLVVGFMLFTLAAAAVAVGVLKAGLALGAFEWFDRRAPGRSLDDEQPRTD